MRPDLDAVSAGDANRKLTQPLGGAISTLLIFAAAAVVAVLVLAPWNHNVIFYGFGSGSACAGVPLNGITISGSPATLAHMRPGMYATTGGQVMVCANQPTTGQRALVTLTQAPSAVLDLAILGMLWQLLRTIRVAGPFALLVARWLRFLGWFILAGSAVVTVGESLAQSAFAATVVSDPVPVADNVINAEVGGIVLPVLVACGLLTLARVIRVGAQMSDDLAGTV